MLPPQNSRPSTPSPADVNPWGQGVQIAKERKFPMITSGGSSRKYPKALAFTLAEALVVIAIMGVLLALLAPALNGWRSAVGTAKALSNGRQLATAAVSYAAEHRGKLPQTDWSSWPDASGYTRWIDEIVPYVYGKTPTNSSGQTMVDGTFRCPGLGGYKKMGNRWNRWEWSEVDWMNVCERYVNGVRVPINTLTCDAVKTPNLVSSDRNNGTTGLYERAESYFQQYVPPSVWIYNGGVIVTYLDGHVEIVVAPTSTNIFKN